MHILNFLEFFWYSLDQYLPPPKRIRIPSPLVFGPGSITHLLTHTTHTNRHQTPDTTHLQNIGRDSITVTYTKHLSCNYMLGIRDLGIQDALTCIMKGVFIDKIVIRWVFATWVFRESGRLYQTLELELGIGDLGVHDVGYRRRWVFRTPILNGI